LIDSAVAINEKGGRARQPAPGLPINFKEQTTMQRKILFPTVILALLAAVSVVRAHDPVKLTGFVVDVLCATDHVKDEAAAATKFAAAHTKECGLMEDCIKSGYGIFSDGKWYPFDEKGNQLARELFEKTQKNAQIKVTVEGKKHGDKILVDKITEE
jgi:hypothetical protein